MHERRTGSEKKSSSRSATRSLSPDRKKKQSNLRSISQLTIAAIVIFVILIWIFYLHPKNTLKRYNAEEQRLNQERLMNLERKQQQQEDSHEDNAVAVVDKNAAEQERIDHNPYYGWQPLIEDEMLCSWRDCFKEGHSCQSCRDATKDLEGTPPPPIDAATGSWIPDVTMLHRMMLEGKDSSGKPWPPSLSKELCEKIGTFGGKNDDNFPLISRVQIVQDSIAREQLAASNRDHTKNIRLFCGIYTMESAHATTVRAIRETWANLCDGFLAFSTASDPRIPAISLPHDGPEEYQNMWQKVRSIWHFIGTHYLDEYDFFFMGGDDLFVIPQNLKLFLKNHLEKTKTTPEDPHFLGRRFKGYGQNNYFNSGGAGYTLSRGTLRKYIHEGGFEHENCSPKRHTAMEDVMIAECFRKVFQIGITDTRDEELRERFHPFSPGTHLGWRPPAPGAKRDWYEDYNTEWGNKLGYDCCAPDSVSFHYIKKPAMVRHLFSLLNYCRE